MSAKKTKLPSAQTQITTTESEATDRSAPAEAPSSLSTLPANDTLTRALPDPRPVEWIEVDGKQVRVLGETMQSLLADPTLLVPPRMIIPGVAAAGRVTMLSAREKLGKSTYVAFLAALVSAGGVFWGQVLEAARVLWIGLEEHRGDAVRRFKAMGADEENIIIVHALPAQDPLLHVRAAMLRWKPALIVIDSLAAYAQGLEDENSAAACTALLTPLVKAVHDSEAGMVILHHAAKSGRGYRGSVAIGAAMDQILEMTDEGTTIKGARRLMARGRFSIKDYEIVFDEDAQTFEVLGEVAAPEEARRIAADTRRLDVREGVLAFILENPGAGNATLRRAVGGDVKLVDEVVKALEAEGLIQRNGKRGGFEIVQSHPQIAA